MVKLKFERKTIEEKIADIIKSLGLTLKNLEYNNNYIMIDTKELSVTQEQIAQMKEKLEKLEWNRKIG